LLSKDYWGKGIMPEAVKAVVDYLFSKTACEEIILGHLVNNKQSERVQDKIGFKVVAQIKDENGDPYIARKITKHDWQLMYPSYINKI
jgi:ribosomal-protein-alanine N-acetyltransferase